MKPTPRSKAIGPAPSWPDLTDLDQAVASERPVAPEPRKRSSHTSAEVVQLTPRLEQEWEELARMLASPPFLHPGWFRAWGSAFGRERVHVLAARRNGLLVGALPLIARRGLTCSPTNWHSPLYGGVFEDADAVEAVARALMRGVRRRLDLTMVDRDDRLLPALRERASTRLIVRPVARQPYVELDGGVDAYSAGLNRKFRKELARLGRRLAERGEVRLSLTDGGDQLEALLERGFRLESSGWKANAGSAILSRPETRSFYSNLARWAADRDWLRLAFLQLDGQEIAFDFCLEHGGSLYALKGGFDPAFRRLGPGIYLTWLTLSSACGRGIGRYELLGSDDPYKLAWTNRTRELVRLQAFGGSVGGRVEHAAFRHARPFAKRLAAVPPRARSGGQRRSCAR